MEGEEEVLKECKGFLLDMDGTLVDSTTTVELIWREWAGLHGLNLQDLLAVAHGQRDVDIISSFAPGLDAQREADWVQRRELECLQGLQAVAGAADFLSGLDTTEWVLVTSASRALAVTRMRAVGLPEPATLVTADDVREGKPSPEGYLRAMRLSGWAPEECIVFEDALPGLQAGRSSGALTVCVRATASSRSLQWPVSIRDFREIELRKDGSGGITVELPTSTS